MRNHYNDIKQHHFLEYERFELAEEARKNADKIQEKLGLYVWNSIENLLSEDLGLAMHTAVIIKEVLNDLDESKEVDS